MPGKAINITKGVSAFNGRNGVVYPASGDYTAPMVGAIPTEEKGAPNGVASLDSRGEVTAEQTPGYATVVGISAMGQKSNGTVLSINNIRGNTILGGTPAYDAPVSMESVEGPLKLHISGKNLIDFSKATKTGTASGVSYSISDDGAISLSGVCDRPGSSAYIMPFGSGISQATYLPAGRYYLSGLNTDYTVSKAVYLYLNCYNSAGEAIVEPNPTVYGPAGVGFTLSEGGAWVTVNTAVKDGTNVDGIVIRPQIEAGNQGTSYELPYSTTVEIPLLGTDGQALEPLRMAYGGSSSAKTVYYDRIVRRNGVWCVQRNTAARELTGAVWTVGSNYAFPSLNWKPIEDGVESYLPMCTHFPSRTSAGSGQDTGVWVGNRLVVGNQVLPNGAQTTAEELKSFCAAQAEVGTPVTVIYALKNPVYEELHQDVQVILNTLCVPGGTCSVWFEGEVAPTADIGIPRGDFPSENARALAMTRADRTLSNLTDYQKALYNIGGSPNRNLVKNWFFRGEGSQLGFGFFPINQTGKTEYVQDFGNAYGPDNWVLEAGSSIALKSTHMEFSTGANAITQPETKEFLDKLVGKQVTVSCLTLENELATATGVVNDFSQSTEIHAVFSGGSFAFMIFPNVAVQVGRLSGSGNIVACKVEEGPVQTLAYKDSSGIWRLFETPDFGEMLLNCQMYSYVPLTSYTGPQFRFYGGSENRLVGILPFPVKMRKAPVLSGFPITFRDTDNGQNVVVDSAQYFICDTGLTLWCQLNTTSGTFVDGHLYTVTSAIKFSAEL